ncbi:MAG: hypothetical protein ACP5PJ_07205 [Acidimicrobiales bacterium]
MIESVINVSEGVDQERLDTLREAVRDSFLDMHVDPDHHRSVFTLCGPHVVRDALSLLRTAITLIDLTLHSGVHPRHGVVDVVPFVPLWDSTPQDALRARTEFEVGAAALGVPTARYGEEVGDPSLPALRQRLRNHPPEDADPKRGVIAVGVRRPLVAYNMMVNCDLLEARIIARQIRSDAIRALALPVGGGIQISTNLIRPERVTPWDVFQLVGTMTEILSTELVGLIPRSVLEKIPRTKWTLLDLDASRTIEARYEAKSGPLELR